MEIEIKNLPEFQVAYLRYTGPYEFESIRLVFSQLLYWAEKKNLMDDNSIILGVSRNNPYITPKDNFIYDACISLPNGFTDIKNMGLRNISGGLFVVYHCEVDDNNFKRPWNDLVFKWLMESGYRPDKRPGYIIYRNNAHTHPEKKWKIDICLPIRNIDRKSPIKSKDLTQTSMATC